MTMALMLERALRAFALLLVASGLAAAQEPADPQQPPAPQSQIGEPDKPADLPVSLDRIRKGLDHPSGGLRIEDDIPRFYVQIERELPRLEHFFPRNELTTGPVPYGGMTHNEFLAMVTPQHLFSSAGITALDTLSVAITSRLLQWLVSRSYAEWREAATERERQEIRARIQRELEALERARQSGPPR
jgi:hypothetical protein